MARLAKRVIVLALGWAFILLGIAGLFLPILQGILFLLIGLAILSTESRVARYCLLRLRRRYPKLSKKLDEAEARAKCLYARVTRRDGMVL